MAIIRWFKYKNSTPERLKKALVYIQNPAKTSIDAQKGFYVGLDQPWHDMKSVQDAHQIKQTRSFKHMVLAFGVRDLPIEIAFKAGCDVGKHYGKNFPTLMCLHHNVRTRLHCHYIYCATDIKTGKKFSQSNDELREFLYFVNEVMEKYDLPKIGQKETSNYKESGDYNMNNQIYGRISSSQSCNEDGYSESTNYYDDFQEQRCFNDEGSYGYQGFNPIQQFFGGQGNIMPINQGFWGQGNIMPMNQGFQGQGNIMPMNQGFQRQNRVHVRNYASYTQGFCLATEYQRLINDYVYGTRWFIDGVIGMNNNNELIITQGIVYDQFGPRLKFINGIPSVIQITDAQEIPNSSCDNQLISNNLRPLIHKKNETHLMQEDCIDVSLISQTRTPFIIAPGKYLGLYQKNSLGVFNVQYILDKTLMFVQNANCEQFDTFSEANNFAIYGFKSFNENANEIIPDTLELNWLHNKKNKYKGRRVFNPGDIGKDF